MVPSIFWYILFIKRKILNSASVGMITDKSSSHFKAIYVDISVQNRATASHKSHITPIISPQNRPIHTKFQKILQIFPFVTLNALIKLVFVNDSSWRADTIANVDLIPLYIENIIARKIDIHIIK